MQAAQLHFVLPLGAMVVLCGAVCVSLSVDVGESIKPFAFQISFHCLIEVAGDS